jgi:hypothetical protein
MVGGYLRLQADEWKMDSRYQVSSLSILIGAGNKTKGNRMLKKYLV